MNIKRKILLIAIMPLIAAIMGIGMVIFDQSRQLSQQQTTTFEKGLVEAKKAELRYYIAFAKNSIADIYHKAGPNDAEAKKKVREILANLSYGPDGYFFVYDYKGTNIIHPRQGFRVGKNWFDLKDSKGNFVIRDLIGAARKGGGYTSYVWEKPSTGKFRKKIGYAIGLDKWQWMLGTGMYIDDITAQVAVMDTDILQKTTNTFVIILIIVVVALAVVGLAGVFLALQENAKSRDQFKALNRAIVEAQEQERTRVARELHDGISQHLSSAKYVFELASIQHPRNPAESVRTLERGISALTGTISEIRRISRDLRPGMLDDLGLAPALSALVSEFEERTSIKVHSQLQPVASRLPDDAKTALFRIAQEAFNNIEKHANATRIDITLKTGQQFVTLRIIDNGSGFNAVSKSSSSLQAPGIGLKNMAERIAHYNGEFDISSSRNGTIITARIISSAKPALAAE